MNEKNIYYGIEERVDMFDTGGTFNIIPGTLSPFKKYAIDYWKKMAGCPTCGHLKTTFEKAILRGEIRLVKMNVLIEESNDE